MATRNDLAIIKAARTGAAAAQYALGSRYFFGDGGLPRSQETAFYWLERAARQGLHDAWLMIGRHVSYELVTTMPRPYEAAAWYEKAFDSGIFNAGLVFARLVLDHSMHFSNRIKTKAIYTLRRLAEQDDHDAQWLLAQQIKLAEQSETEVQIIEPAIIQSMAANETRWIASAANAGVMGAQFALLERSREKGDDDTYLQVATPLIDKLLAQHALILDIQDKTPSSRVDAQLAEHEIRMLLCYAELISDQPELVADDLRKVLELAALAGDAVARYKLGLFHARMDSLGNRVLMDHRMANYKLAIPWLIMAGQAGVPQAWHALSLIFGKSEYSQRDLPTSRRYLEQAAELGVCQAQFELAQHTWRSRGNDRLKDIRALFWWNKAAMQGHVEAKSVLHPFTAESSSEQWGRRCIPFITCQLRSAHPFLIARIELAEAFGLSRAEALLLDVKKSDYGHCLLVDITNYHGKSKKRLIVIESRKQRETLNLISRLFSDVDSGYDGPEGNYRQRMYRLKSLFPSEE
jgi:FOG: TPR repeat, SEL1 subfamily